jgi:bilirubin oxidase
LWELHNVTADAHPIHIHEILFEVVDRHVAAAMPRSGRRPCRSAGAR